MKVNKHYKLDIIKNPSPVYYGSHSENVSFGYNEHEHVDICEIILLKKGRAQITVDKVKHTFSRGSLIIFNPSVKHEEMYFPDEEGKFLSYYIAFGNYLINGKNNDNFLPEGCQFFAQTTESEMENLINIIDKISDEYKSKNLGYSEVIKSLCSQFSLYTLRIFDRCYSIYDKSDDSEQQLAVIDVRNFIDENFSDSALNMSVIEKAVHLSKYYISHLFKRSTGISVFEYLISKRMEYACLLLKDTNLTVLEVAKKSGYTNIYQFHRQFKKRLGVTPVMYRKSFNH